MTRLAIERIRTAHDEELLRRGLDVDGHQLRRRQLLAINEVLASLRLRDDDALGSDSTAADWWKG